MAAPLKLIVATLPGPPHVIEDDELSLTLRTVVHVLECGHRTEPEVRDGCRLPPLPKRKRCKQCLEAK
jgi:hypothetical protein